MGGRQSVMLTVALAACANEQPAIPATGSLVAPRSLSDAALDVPHSVAWNRDGSLVVIDRSEQRVLVMAPEADTIIRTIGARGTGPGEFTGATVVGAAADGSILVLDALLRRASVFDEHGTFLTSVTVPGVPSHVLGGLGADTMLIAWTEFGPGRGPVVGVVTRSSAQPVVLFDVFAAAPGLAVRSPMTGQPIPFLAMALSQDHDVLAGSVRRYSIDRLTLAGELVDSFGRPELPPTVMTDAQFAKRRRAALQSAAQQGIAIPPERLGSLIDQQRNEPLPSFGSQGIVPLPTGGAWVITGRGGEEQTEVDEFDATGKYSRTLLLRDRVRAGAVLGNRVAVVVERAEVRAELGPIDIYRVEWGRQ